MTPGSSLAVDPCLKENLYDEFVKHGGICAIKIEGDGDKKVGLVVYKHGESAQAAVENLNNQLFLQQTSLRVERIDIPAHMQQPQQQPAPVSSHSVHSVRVGVGVAETWLLIKPVYANCN